MIVLWIIGIYFSLLTVVKLGEVIADRKLKQLKARKAILDIRLEEIKNFQCPREKLNLSTGVDTYVTMN